MITPPPTPVTLAAVIRDTLDNDTGELRFTDIDTPLLQGRLEVNYTRTNTGTDAFITVANSTGSTSNSRSIIDLRINNDSLQVRDQPTPDTNGETLEGFIPPTEPDVFQNVVITWSAVDDVTPPSVVLIIDGVTAAEFTSSVEVAGDGQNPAGFVGSGGIGGAEQIQFRFGGNGAVSELGESFTILDFALHDNVEGAGEPLFATDFSEFNEGDSLDTGDDDPDNVNPDSPFNGSTSEARVEIIPVVLTAP